VHIAILSPFGQEFILLFPLYMREFPKRDAEGAQRSGNSSRKSSRKKREEAAITAGLL
jgi:hypothetical protein